MIESDDKKGHIHPLSSVIHECALIFNDLGFEIALGPEIENEYYNFDSLNISADHPARDMWDTFWLRQRDEDRKSKPALLRTHTSPVQIRFMEKHNPPLRIISPGKVFRFEATDATHEAQFYQLEGLCIDNDVSLAHLKGTIEKFFEKFFKRKVKSRFRPSFFPFVEPGVEVDIECFKCLESRNDSCALCKGARYIEIMGAGMVHPQILRNAKINPKKWSGFAFGFGIDRLAMLRFSIPDVRMFYTGDLRVTNQF